MYFLKISELLKVREISEKHFKDAKQNIEEIEQLHDITQINNEELQKKKKNLEELKGTISKSYNELSHSTAILNSVIDNAKMNELNEESVYRFAQTSTKYQENWLQNYCRKQAITECIQHLKNAYENSNISLADLIKNVRKLGREQFVNIWNMEEIEKISKDNKEPMTF